MKEIGKEEKLEKKRGKQERENDNFESDLKVVKKTIKLSTLSNLVYSVENFNGDRFQTNVFFRRDGCLKGVWPYLSYTSIN